MSANQHTTPREPIFPRVKLSGKNPATEKTANPAHTAELVKPSVPDSMTPSPKKAE